MARAPEPLAPADIAHEAKHPGAGEFVSWLVKCLYVDEALPRARLLQWQLQLLLGVNLGNKELRDLVRAAPGVYIEPDSAPKLAWSALLRTPPPGFRGFRSEETDVVSEESSTTIMEAERVFALGGWPETSEKNHKYYIVASWLQDNSEHLHTLSFGRLLSLVHYGASRSLLGHRAGQLVPYAQCELYEREVNARNCQPTKVGEGESYVSTWGELRSCLHKLLAAGPTKEVEMAKLKALFRSNFGMELSETAFGYQSLTKLLADPEVATEFVTVALQPLNGSGAYFVRARPHTVSLDSLIGEEPEGGEDETVAEGQASQQGTAELAA